MIRAARIALVVAGMMSLAGSAQATPIGHAPMIRIHTSRPFTQTQSTNWSGYATYKSGTTFTDVKGSWTQPTGSCPKTKKTYSSFWVGIDGYNSNSVEQLGTEVDCTGVNQPVYYAWYEMYPSAPVTLSMTVHPGDSFSAEVSASGSTFTLSITNNTTGQSFSVNKTSSSAAKSSAEWVAEAPSSCRISCTVLPLTSFGTVDFTGSYTTGNGHTGSISDSAWSNDEITMVTRQGAVKAQPSTLSVDGTSFSVTWHHV